MKNFKLPNVLLSAVFVFSWRSISLLSVKIRTQVRSRIDFALKMKLVPNTYLIPTKEIL